MIKITAHVVKEDVNAFGRHPIQRLLEVFACVVDDVIEGELLFAPLLFLFGTDDADHNAFAELGQLAHNVANGARSCRHQNNITGFWLTLLEGQEGRCA